MLYWAIALPICRYCGEKSADESAAYCPYCGKPYYWAPYKIPPIPFIGIITIGVGLFQFAFGYSNPTGTLEWAIIDYVTGVLCCSVGAAYLFHWNKARKMKFRPLEDNETAKIEEPSEEEKEQALKYD